VIKTSVLRRGEAISGLARIGSPLAIEAVVSVWEKLARHDRESALVELGPQLRDALERAGKAIKEK
jgi:hypothetical protein